MFEKIRLKFYSYWISRNKPKKEGFVNPYPSRLNAPESARLTPYITDYGTKKPKSFTELIFKKKQDERELPNIRRLPPVDVVEISQEPVGPTFFEDMVRVSSGDVIFFATTCRSILPRLHALLPKRAEPRIMSGDEIRMACENLRW